MRLRLPAPGARLCVLLATAAVGGCGGSPDGTEVARSVHSWSATSQLVIDRWEHGAVSRRFTALTLDRAAAELQSLQKETSALPDTARDRDARVAQVVNARRAVVSADSAVQRDDRAATRAAMLRLRSTDSADAALSRGTWSKAQ